MTIAMSQAAQLQIEDVAAYMQDLGRRARAASRALAAADTAAKDNALTAITLDLWAVGPPAPARIRDWR